MKKIISLVLLMAFVSVFLVVPSGLYAQEDAGKMTFGQFLPIHMDEVYGVTIFPLIAQEQVTDRETIQQFLKELSLFDVEKADAGARSISPAGGKFIEVYGKDGKRLDGVYIQDGYMERGYMPAMSRMPMLTHRVTDAEGFDKWLQGYIGRWSADTANSPALFEDTTEGYHIGESEMIVPYVTDKANRLNKMGLFKGTENGYELEKSVTRAESVVMVLRLLGEEKEAEKIAEENPFKDVPNTHWGACYMTYAYKKGYINGTGADTFDPERSVTGREFVKILLSAMGYQGVTIENAYEAGIKYSLLLNQYSKLAVSQPAYFMRRNDLVEICYSALLAETPSGKMLKDVLVEKGVLTQEMLEIMSDDSAAGDSGIMALAQKLKIYMPIDRNYMFSPLSIKLAFAMAANGASGVTQREILQTMGIDNLGDYNSYAKKLISELNQDEAVQFNIANAIWLNTDYYKNSTVKFSAGFQNTVNDFYFGEAALVNDKNAVKTINDWISGKTNDRIKDVLKNSDFLAALVNTIYFKGQWASTFDEDATAKKEFTDRNNKKSELNFMSKTTYLNYFEDDTAQAVAIPYKNRNISMVIVLPKNENYRLETITKNMQPAYVALSMPKFKTEFDIKLNDVLKSMGIRQAFGDQAEFKDTMFENAPKPIVVTGVLHKTFIDVNEWGTEAAAVTVISMGGTSVPPVPKLFTADRPFTYFIWDSASGEVLFMGEYAYGQ